MKMDFAVGTNRDERMDEIADHARVAEESGFKFVTYVDQPFMSRDVFASMTLAALKKSRLRWLPAVAELKGAGLRRTVYEWAVRRARRDGLVLEEVDMEGTYFRSRIGENMRRATRAWFAEGVEEGLRRGREQGVEQQRALLVRQITTKFGAVAAQRVGPLLDRVAAPALLAEVGDALLVCATETELVARVEAVIASMAPSADTDPSSGH